MLEYPHLRLQPWKKIRSPEGMDTRLRSITDGVGARLGAVQLVGPASSSWFAWLRASRLEIVETDDDALLMTLRQSWGLFNVWEVSEADGLHVGSVYSRTLISSLGDCLAYIDRDIAGNARVLDPAGAEIAAIREMDSGGAELTFKPAETTNPFLRMMLLACAITMNVAP